MSGQTCWWRLWFSFDGMSRCRVLGMLSILLAEWGSITSVDRAGCSFLDCEQRLCLEGDVGQVCSWMHSPIFLKTVTDWRTDNFDENIDNCRFLIDVCNFAGFGIYIVSVLHSNHVCRLRVAKDLALAVHRSYCLAVCNCL